MERENSFQNVSSEGVSESGSLNQYETGFYMSSFAATVFIAGLITIGILLITSLVTLIVMLQSCQSSGIFESQKSYYNDDYCKIILFHMELNQLDTIELPSICKDYALYYTSEGQFVRDLNFSISMAEKFFSGIIRPYNHDFKVVLMDIDDILPSSFHYSKPLKSSCRDCIEEEINLRRMLMLRLYNRIQESGWTLILITRRAQKQQNSITKYLVSAGYIGWASLIMRSTDERMLSSLEYFSRRIAAIERQGYHIAGVISSSLDSLVGLSMGKPVFKLPKMKFQNKECLKLQLKIPANNQKLEQFDLTILPAHICKATMQLVLKDCQPAVCRNVPSFNQYTRTSI